MPPRLSEDAEQPVVADRFTDAAGREQVVDPAVVARIAELIGRPQPGALTTVVTRPGGSVPGGPGTVQLEDGGELRVADRLPADTPYGYHTLRPDHGGERTLIVSPGRCHLPPGWRAWGWAVQLYATRSAESWGIGDLADLARLGRWSAGSRGAGFVMVNPLDAVIPAVPPQPSPYFPASRRFRNPIYLRVEDVPGADAVDLSAWATQGRALNAERGIDRDAVWGLKLAALEAIWPAGRGEPEFTGWYAQAPESLHEFATWSVLAEEMAGSHGVDWRRWPEDYSRPDAPGVAAFAARHADRVAFHAWLQWLTERQLTAASGDLRLIQDVPIGVDPAGADAWAWQELLATGATVGAPPDEFNQDGQNWGLPPFVPWRLTAAGYRPFVDTVRAALAQDGGLRIDHVMGLFRLWWVPEGSQASGGTYVRYPADDLLDILALESHRARAVVVGEDLGTVLESAREAMAERDVLSYRLLWFEDDDPNSWPQRAMAAVTTHDLPTVVGLWDGSDLTAQKAAGLNPNEEGTAAIRERLSEAGGLRPGASAEEAVLAAHRLLARAPSVLLAATLDDALAEPERPNIPGADGRRPNWSLALPVDLEGLERHPLANRVAELLAEAAKS